MAESVLLGGGDKDGIGGNGDECAKIHNEKQEDNVRKCVANTDRESQEHSLASSAQRRVIYRVTMVSPLAGGGDFAQFNNYCYF